MFVFFKQKTAYEMRISDWSSDVCNSTQVTEYTGRDERQGSMHGTTHVYGRGAINVDQGLAANIMKARAMVRMNTCVGVERSHALCWFSQINSSTAASASKKADEDDEDDDW